MLSVKGRLLLSSLFFGFLSGSQLFRGHLFSARFRLLSYINLSLFLQIMLLVSVKEGEIYFLKIIAVLKNGRVKNTLPFFVFPIFKEPKKVPNKLLPKVPYQEDRGFWGRFRKAPFWRSFRWRLFPLRPVLL